MLAKKQNTPSGNAHGTRAHLYLANERWDEDEASSQGALTEASEAQAPRHARPHLDRVRATESGDGDKADPGQPAAAA